jgi:nicotinamidase/pyrazinamidase
VKRSIVPRDDDVLLVVDMQNDFCPGGALAVPEGDAVIPVINGLAGRFRHAVLTQDWHPPGHLSFASSHAGRKPGETMELGYGRQILWPDHCVQSTHGAELHEDLAVGCADIVIRKGTDPSIDSYSAFYENDRKTPTGLAGYLKELKLGRIYVAGLATDFCVQYTALDARRTGFTVVVVEDACRGIDLEGSLESSRLNMHMAGIELVRAADLMEGA